MLKFVSDILKKKSVEKNHLICDFVRGGLIFSQDGIIKVCAKSSCDMNSQFSLINDFNGLWFDCNTVKEKLNELKSKFQGDNIPSECQNCCYLVDSDNVEGHEYFDFIVLSHWKCCFLNCLYCNDKKTDDLSTVEHFDIMPVIQQLIDENLITKETKIIFDCGDATLHPEFDKLMYFFLNYEMKDIEIHTSAQRYCHSVAEAIGKNIAKVVVSLDGGCPYIYERIKGVNKYDIAISNIKRYLEYQDKNRKQVVLNYTLIERINDNKKEILDWFMNSRGLGIKKFSIDIDEKWYNNLKFTVPSYLEEIMFFSKELAEFNNIELDFSPRLNSLYAKINKKAV